MKAVSPLLPWIRIIRERRWRLLLGGMLMLATLASALGLLTLSGWFITATSLAAMSAIGYLDVFTPGSGIRLFAVSRTASRYVERLYNHDTVLRLLADLRGRVFTNLLRMDDGRLSRSRASQWLNRLTADIDTLDTLYLRLLAPPVVALVGIAAFALFAGMFLPSAGWVLALTLLPLWLAVTLGAARWGWRLSHRRVGRQERLRGRAIELIEGLPELLAYRALARHRLLWRNEEEALVDDQRRLGRRVAAGNGLVTLGVQFAALAVLTVAAVAFRDAAITGPVMVMLVLGTLALGEALGGLPAAFAQLGATVRAAERLNAQTEEPTSLNGEVDEPSGAAPSLNYREVEVRRRERRVFGALSLAVGPGERVGIIGPSGIGKSTLAELAVRRFDPDAGGVDIAGRNLTTLAPASLRAGVGYLTQRSELFHDTLAANLRMGKPDASDAELWDVLDRVSLRGWSQALPEGLATWVGEQGRQLSGGQARRVALARVLLRDSPLVILDEPFSGLDGETAERLKAALDTWIAGRTVLALGHARHALPRCDRYYRCSIGPDGAVLVEDRDPVSTRA